MNRGLVDFLKRFGSPGDGNKKKTAGEAYSVTYTCSPEMVSGLMEIFPSDTAPSNPFSSRTVFARSRDFTCTVIEEIAFLSDFTR